MRPIGPPWPSGAGKQLAAEFQLREIRLIRSAERKNESVGLCVVYEKISLETDPSQLLVDRQTENIEVDLKDRRNGQRVDRRALRERPSQRGRLVPISEMA